MRTVGVEEELMLVDPTTGVASQTSAAVLREHRRLVGEQPPSAAHELDAELIQYMVETHTAPADNLDSIEEQLLTARQTTIAAAEAAGVAIAAVGHTVLPPDGPALIAPDDRYARIVHEFGPTARQAGTMGMHVHIAIDSPQEGVRAIDGLRPWLPLLVAIAANSPYADGVDTGYASWRQQVWKRWPTAGPAEPFGSLAEYRRVTEALIASGAALDAGMLYFDVRLAARYPTVEIRVADVCTDLGDGLLVTALARALVETAAAGEAPPAVRSDLVRAALWRASRSGLDGELMHPHTGELAPAFDALGVLVEYVEPALTASGDLDRVSAGVERLRMVGTGARRLRQAYERGGSMSEVVADLVRRTAAEPGGH